LEVEPPKKELQKATDPKDSQPATQSSDQ